MDDQTLEKNWQSVSESAIILVNNNVIEMNASAREEKFRGAFRNIICPEIIAEDRNCCTGS